MGVDAASAGERLRISTRRDELDVQMIHRFLSQEAYWSRQIPRPEIYQAAAATTEANR